MVRFSSFLDMSFNTAPPQLRVGAEHQRSFGSDPSWRMCPFGNAETHRILVGKIWKMMINCWIWGFILFCIYLVHVMYSSYYSFILSRRIISLHKQSPNKLRAANSHVTKRHIWANITTNMWLCPPKKRQPPDSLKPQVHTYIILNIIKYNII